MAFDDVRFPLELGRDAEVAPTFSTAIVSGAGGAEQRNAGWAEARTFYDVGPGVRSEADIAALLAFFRARMGPARGFRLRDPFDFSGEGEAIGTGDGAERRFALVKHYGDQLRRITRPVAGSVSVRVAGVATQGFAVEAGGWVVLDAAPVAGAAVVAGFGFDVPVRFAEDRLSVTAAAWRAGKRRACRWSRCGKAERTFVRAKTRRGEGWFRGGAEAQRSCAECRCSVFQPVRLEGALTGSGPGAAGIETFFSAPSRLL